jgi:hypothetical protein
MYHGGPQSNVDLMPVANYLEMAARRRVISMFRFFCICVLVAWGRKCSEKFEMIVLMLKFYFRTIKIYISRTKSQNFISGPKISNFISGPKIQEHHTGLQKQINFRTKNSNFMSGLQKCKIFISNSKNSIILLDPPLSLKKYAQKQQQKHQ